MTPLYCASKPVRSWALRLPVPTRYHLITTLSIADLADTSFFALRVGTRVVPLSFDESSADIWRLADVPLKVDGYDTDVSLDVRMAMTGTPVGDFAFVFPFRDGLGIDPRIHRELGSTDNVVETTFDWATRALGPRSLPSHLDWLERGAFTGGSWMALRLCESYTLAARANVTPTSLVPLPEPLRWWCHPDATLWATA